MIALIWAMTKTRIIGNHNQLPWHDSAEMAYFRTTTKGHPLLMGYNTYKSLKQPTLPGRKLFVASKTKRQPPTISLEQVEFISDLDQLIAHYQTSAETLFVCGGAQIYKLTLPHADYLYVSIMNQEFDGDIKFPKFNWHKFQLQQSTTYETFIAKIYKRRPTNQWFDEKLVSLDHESCEQ